MSEEFNSKLDNAYNKQKYRKFCEIYIYDMIKNQWHDFQKKYDLKCRWKEKDYIPLMFCKSEFLKKVFPKIPFKDKAVISKTILKILSDCFTLKDQTIQISQDYKSNNDKTDFIHIVAVVFYLSDFGKRYKINKSTQKNISLDKFSNSIIENLNSGNLQNQSETDNDEYNDEDLDEAENELNEAEHLTQLTDGDIEALSKRHDDDYINEKIKVI